MRKANGIIRFQYIVSFCSLIALFIQLLPNDFVPEEVKIILLKAVIVLIVVNIIVSLVTRNVFRRPRLVSKSIKLMKNAQRSVTMFGGDLSWANDYKDTIKALTNDGKRVDVIFPMPEYNQCTPAAKCLFETNISLLEQAGAQVYSTDQDFDLRCTIIDVERRDSDEDMKVISSKSTRSDHKQKKKHKYRVYIFRINKFHEKIYCTLYRNSWELLYRMKKPYQKP